MTKQAVKRAAQPSLDPSEPDTNQDVSEDTISVGIPTPQVITASEDDTDTIKAQNQQEAAVVPADACGEGTAAADAATEAHTERVVTPRGSSGGP